MNQTCTRCQTVLPEGALGNRCPKCLFEIGLEDSSSPAADPARLRDETGGGIGRYKLLEQIGEGGCGVVYMAEQEEPVRRKVALKIIKLGLETRTVIARFEAERQALALMDHPNIARIFDGGATERGRPYFVMELVRGIKITDYCDQRELLLRERLDLFIDVCQAVQHAHQKGIIHRDLKPSNILVAVNDGVAVPKVIDFGVAKATEQRLTSKTTFTQFHAFVGTPAYMSPEQAEMSSLDIDTRSDIYSLGVLLYELLTGRTPFDHCDLLQSGIDEMRRIIREKEPDKPSTRLMEDRVAADVGKLTSKPERRDPKSEDAIRASSRRRPRAKELAGALRGDLDWIVMKCLEKDRARRYETATGLATDLQRHLGNEPIMARPPSAAYRFQKLIRRNKLAFAAVVAVSLTLLGGIAGSSWQAVRATRAEQAARHQAEIASEQSATAQAVQEFLTEHLLGGGVDIFWATNTDFIAPEVTRALVERVARKVEGRFTNQPAVEVGIRQTLLRAFWGQGDYTNVAAQGERLLELHRELLGPYHSDTLETIASLAEAKYFTGQRREAYALLHEALTAIRGSTNALSAGAGMILLKQGELTSREEEALVLVKEAHKVLEQTIGRTNPTHLTLKYVKHRIAYLTQLSGQWDTAEALWRELLRERERDYGSNHSTTFQTRFGLARLLVEKGQIGEAQSLLEPLVAFHQQRLGTNHGLTLDSQYWLGQVYEQQGRIEEVFQLYTDICPRLGMQLPRGGAIHGCTRMSEFFVRHRRFAEARAGYNALRMAWENLSIETRDEFDALVTATAAAKGWPAAAEIYRKHGSRFATSLTMLRTIATILLYVGDREGYRDTVEKALDLTTTTGNRSEDQRTMLATAALGWTALFPAQVRQCEAMLPSLEDALSAPPTNGHAKFYRTLGAVQLRLGRAGEALKHLKRAQAALPANDQGRGLILQALCLHRLNRIEDARRALVDAEAIIKPPLPEPLPEYDGFLSEAQLYDQILHREAEALMSANLPKP